MKDFRQAKAYLLLVAGIGMLLIFWQRSMREKLVIYCAHDAVFADELLREFERKTGIPVAVKYDTEATKSLGLAEQIIREAGKPRCDVFWNNELLATLDLAERGLLEPYEGDGWKRIPENFRDPKARWAGFGARLRMKILSLEVADAAEPTPELFKAESNPALFSRFAIAKPLYGTTLTHYTVLWNLWGPGKLQQWHRDCRARGIREVNGNAMVRDVVASGECTAGYTDTDDYFEALDKKKPVRAVPVEVDGNRTICIPNTVAIVKGARHADEARKFVDFLLSARSEAKLAASASRQIPLGPLPPELQKTIPVEVRELMEPASRGIPLEGLLSARNACLDWLRQEYVK